MKKTVGLSKSDQILQTLEQDIVSGKVAHGDRLDSENTLMQRFSVSRNTVRKGLDQLARQGMITKRSGIGSFVTYNGQSINDALGWTRALSVGDTKLDTRITSLRRASCSRTQHFLLSIHDPLKMSLPTDDFLRVDRVRINLHTGIGLSLERSRLPWLPCFQAILDEGLDDNSLSKTLANLGIAATSGEEWAKVMPRLSARDASLMHRQPGEPMLKLQRVTRREQSDIVEYVESILDPVRFALHLSF